jgi:hypothetical protein
MTTAVLPLLTTWLRRLAPTAPRDASGLSRSIALTRGEARTIARAGNSTRLAVTAGVVWVTTTPPDEGDVVLRAGEHLAVGSNWPVVIQALENARVAIE